MKCGGRAKVTGVIAPISAGSAVGAGFEDVADLLEGVAEDAVLRAFKIRLLPVIL